MRSLISDLQHSCSLKMAARPIAWSTALTHGHLLPLFLSSSPRRSSLPPPKPTGEPRARFPGRQLRAVYASPRPPPPPPEAADLALRLTRRALLDLYSGYAPGHVRPRRDLLFRRRRMPPAEQPRLQQRLKSPSLASPRPRRSLSLATPPLRGELIPLLRQQLQRASPLTRRLSRSKPLRRAIAHPPKTTVPLNTSSGLAALRLVTESASPSPPTSSPPSPPPWTPGYRPPYFRRASSARPVHPAAAAAAPPPTAPTCAPACLPAWRDLQALPPPNVPTPAALTTSAPCCAPWGWRGPAGRG